MIMMLEKMANLFARLRREAQSRRAQQYLSVLIDNGASGQTINMAMADQALDTEDGPWIDWMRTGGYQQMFGLPPRLAPAPRAPQDRAP